MAALSKNNSQPGDLPLLLSQTKYNWSLATVHVVEDSATHEMNAHQTSSVYIRGCSIVCRREDGLSRLIYLCYYPKQSIIGL